jgi:hypothetical protein
VRSPHNGVPSIIRMFSADRLSDATKPRHSFKGDETVSMQGLPLPFCCQSFSNSTRTRMEKPS